MILQGSINQVAKRLHKSFMDIVLSRRITESNWPTFGIVWVIIIIDLVLCLFRVTLPLSIGVLRIDAVCKRFS
jgi:hypothetical protein